MILEIAVADAYCIPFEFIERDKYPGPNDLSGYYQHPEYSGLKPSQYTDDTLRTVATAKVIMGGDWAVPHEYVRALQKEFIDDPRDGFSRRFQAYLEDNKHDHPVVFMRKLTRKSSNGSLMGCLPCGFLPDPKDVMLAAMMQAISTHSANTVPYAQTLALAAHHLMRGGKVAGLFAFWNDCGVDASIVEGPRPKPSYCGMGAKETTSQVLNLLFNFRSLSNIMEATVEAGGDTDSAAALAVGLASLSDEFINDIPEYLIEQLEFGNAETRERLLATETLLRRQIYRR